MIKTTTQSFVSFLHVVKFYQFTDDWTEGKKGDWQIITSIKDRHIVKSEDMTEFLQYLKKL